MGLSPWTVPASVPPARRGHALGPGWLGGAPDLRIKASPAHQRERDRLRPVHEERASLVRALARSKAGRGVYGGGCAG